MRLGVFWEGRGVAVGCLPRELRSWDWKMLGDVCQKIKIKYTKKKRSRSWISPPPPPPLKFSRRGVVYEKWREKNNIY